MSLIATFHAAGVLDDAAVAIATRFGELADESDERVLLALAFAVRALGQGSVCFDLLTVHTQPLERTDDGTTELPWPEPRAWLESVTASSLVTCGEEPVDATAPLRLVDGQLYLEKYWLTEEAIRVALEQRLTATPPTVDNNRLTAILDEKFPPELAPASGPDEARAAADHAARNWLTVVVGGPGTGKTTTIKRIVAVLQDLLGPTARIRLAAPTGRAAARMAEATGHPAQTVHRLIGIIPNRPDPRHHPGNPVPCDVVIIDELSMVSLEIMSMVVAATASPQGGHGTRLVFVGDPDQLESVEAGAVLADITHSRVPVCPLTHTWRYAGRLADVASAVRDGAADTVVELLTAPVVDPSIDNARLVSFDATAHDVPDALREPVLSAHAARASAAEQGDARAALAALASHRVLCAHRSGPFGLYRWNREIDTWLGHRGQEWYPGRPVLVTHTDRDLGLTNGDTGVAISTPDGLRVAFERADGSLHLVPPTRLDHLQTAHVMTVHKSQGSQYQHVAVLLPPLGSPLLTRELVYTAVTRAQRSVTVFGSEEALREATRREVSRASGLRRRLLAEQ